MNNPSEDDSQHILSYQHAKVRDSAVDSLLERLTQSFRIHARGIHISTADQVIRIFEPTNGSCPEGDTL